MLLQRITFLKKQMFKIKSCLQHIYTLIFIGLVCLAYIPFGYRSNFILQSVFLGIGSFSLYMLWKEKDNRFTLNSIFYIFTLFFFSIAPIIQYQYKIVFFGAKPIADIVYLKSSVILLLSVVLYAILYQFFKKKIQFNSHDNYKKNHNKNYWATILLSLASVVLYVYLINFDIYYLLNRAFQSGLKEHVKFGAVGYGLLLIIRNIPFIVVLKAFYDKANWKYITLCLFLMLIVMFPTSLSRGRVAIVYIPIFLLIFKRFRENIFFSTSIMVSLLFVFPLLNLFRENIFQFNFSDFQLFTTGHFDAFQNVTLLFKNNIITNGRQLIGSFLFFKHHTPWFGEINGTGHLMGQIENYNYLNVSMPFIGEGYANFGYVGIVIFITLLALLNAYFDQLDIKMISLHQYILLFTLIGWEFYLLRGDLMSSFKIIFSIVIALFLINKIQIAQCYLKKK